MLSPKNDFRDDESGRLADFGELMKEEEGDDSQMDMDDQLFHQQQQQQQQNQFLDPKMEPMETKFDLPASPPRQQPPQPVATPQPPTPVQQQLMSPQQPAPTVIKSPIKEEVIVKEEKPVVVKVEPPPPPPKVEPVIKIEEPEPEPVKVEEPPAPIYTARWGELEEKVLKRIFSFCVVNDGSVPFLVRASRVCSSWHKASQDVKLWTHLDLSQGRLKEKYRNDKKLEWFLKKYPHVLEVKLGGWKNSVGTSTLRLIATHCPNLISIGLSGCLKLTNEDLKVVGDSFPKLERIDLSGVSVNLKKIACMPSFLTYRCCWFNYLCNLS
jgi:hypothetical protein